uniref:LCP family protein n=1 Tax=Ndongobacter massiliensis TaxID=1871025 RepID=UPI0009306C8B|nr:LCP family protein [Ndongobacter massiliensis]
MVRKNPFILTGILIVLSTVALILTGYLGFILFANNILPFKYRAIGLGLGALFALLFLGLAILHGGRFQKVVGILLCSVLIFFLDVIILFAQSGMRALNEIQVADSSDPAARPDDTKPSDAAVDVRNGSFVVYISGLDTYGAIEEQSRSDVNIVAAINSKTRKILMVSVPRDSYVPIGGDGQWEKDKLTHAGLYGVEASVATLERVLDTKIDYYVRLNFTSFLEIIDVVGGITVDNPESFVANDGHYYPEGEVEMSGEEALMFVRERYHLSEGDFGRQHNQQLVIEAVFRKILGPELVMRFQSIMDTVANSLQTNMPTHKIWDFVNAQMDHADEWDFETIGIPGEGVVGLDSFAMPENKELWFYELDEEGLTRVQKIFREVLDGKEVTLDTDQWSDTIRDGGAE